MNTDRIARTAAEDLRTHTTADVERGLAALLDAPSPRPRSGRAAATLVAAAAVAVAWWGAATYGHHRTAPEPVGPAICQARAVTCVAPHTYDFALPATVRWRVPSGYDAWSGGGAGDLLVEIYSPQQDPASGVTVLEKVRAAAHTSHPGPARGIPATATAFIHWLAGRPYLKASTPRPTTFDGRPAWHVRVALRAGAPVGPAICANSQFACQPVMYAPSTTLGVTGIWSDMVADYTAFDLPGHGTTVVWSWSFGGDPQALQQNRALVDGISFPDA